MLIATAYDPLTGYHYETHMQADNSGYFWVTRSTQQQIWEKIPGIQCASGKISVHYKPTTGSKNISIDFNPLGCISENVKKILTERAARSVAVFLLKEKVK